MPVVTPLRKPRQLWIIHVPQLANCDQNALPFLGDRFDEELNFSPRRTSDSDDGVACVLLDDKRSKAVLADQRYQNSGDAISATTQSTFVLRKFNVKLKCICAAVLIIGSWYMGAWLPWVVYYVPGLWWLIVPHMPEITSLLQLHSVMGACVVIQCLLIYVGVLMLQSAVSQAVCEWRGLKDAKCVDTQTRTSYRDLDHVSCPEDRVNLCKCAPVRLRDVERLPDEPLDELLDVEPLQIKSP